MKLFKEYLPWLMMKYPEDAFEIVVSTEFITIDSFLSNIVSTVESGMENKNLKEKFLIFYNSFPALGIIIQTFRKAIREFLIIFFLIEVLLALVIFGVGYIVADQKSDAVLKYLDNKSGGVISYFEIKDYKDFKNLLKLSDYLVEKDKPEDKEPEEEEVVIPKTCYAYNPVGIESLEDFNELFEAQYAEPSEEIDEEEIEQPLFELLAAANVDVENSEYIYIILDNKKESSVIMFNKAGQFQSFPTSSLSEAYAYVGGAK